MIRTGLSGHSAAARSGNIARTARKAATAAEIPRKAYSLKRFLWAGSIAHSAGCGVTKPARLALLRGFHAEHLGDPGKLFVQLLDAGRELSGSSDIDDLAGGFELGRDRRVAGDGGADVSRDLLA